MTASPSLTLLQAGTSPRLAPLLDRALEGIPAAGFRPPIWRN